eukprot:1427205-Amphidinium_carterae.1
MLRKDQVGPLGAKWVHTAEHAMLEGAVGLVVSPHFADAMSKALSRVPTGYDREGIVVGPYVFFELLDWVDHLMVENPSELRSASRQLKKA